MFTFKIVRRLFFLFHPKFVWLRVSLEVTYHHLISGNYREILKQILLLAFFKKQHSSLFFPGCASGKEPPAVLETWEAGSIPGPGKIPWRMAWQPTPVSLPAKSHGQRSLAGSMGCKGQTRLKRFSTHAPLFPKWKGFYYLRQICILNPSNIMFCSVTLRELFAFIEPQFPHP